jgi:LPPG:FO 2-phospho-L-lactate transferase
VIAVLCGGVGAARMLRGLAMVHPAADTLAVVNTGDDTVLHGLAISPDLDTITYTLSEAIDPERGWGLAGETWQAMAGLARFEAARPAGSAAGATWFNLGDGDLATHLYRTGRLAEGATLAEVTAEIAAAFGVAQRLVPMSNDPVRTMITLADPAPGEATEVPFQEYFVRLRHSVPVHSVRFQGAGTATLHPAAANALDTAEAVVIAPSNPLVSVAPIRALAGVDQRLAARRESVVAVSPIVGGAALKGPADRMMDELGHSSSVVAVARLYAPIAATLVIDPADEHLAGAVAETGMRPLVVPSVMSKPQAAAELAARTLGAARRA